tara:strand:- start:1388 stop:1864 length:477 start_codon:yes stop_codon:yes gene_type:complete
MQKKKKENGLEFFVQSEKDTKMIARRLAKIVQKKDIVALSGDLGVGKTVFARAFINALPGSLEEVLSPSFPILQIYERAKVEVYHFDFFRLEKPEDAFELGIEEAFGCAISLIEWPERLDFILPKKSLEIEISFLGGVTERVIKISGSKVWAKRIRNI